MQAPHLRSDNHGALRYLGQGLAPDAVPVAVPAPDVDTWHLGAHPDVVARLWEVLNAALPTDARCLVAGGAALVDPASGLILAAALGTRYALRLTGRPLAEALAAGLATVHLFSTVGRTLDLEETFGPGWVFGAWDDREAAWLAESHAGANL
jgi:hypothetical protein